MKTKTKISEKNTKTKKEENVKTKEVVQVKKVAEGTQDKNESRYLTPFASSSELLFEGQELLRFSTWENMLKYIYSVMGNKVYANLTFLKRIKNSLGLDRILLESYVEESGSIPEIYIDIQRLSALNLAKFIIENKLTYCSSLLICKNRYLVI